MTNSSDLAPRFSVSCPLCKQHDLIVTVERPDFSIGWYYASIGDVSNPEPDNADAEAHWEEILEILSGDDAEATRMAGKLFDGNRN